MLTKAYIYLKKYGFVAFLLKCMRTLRNNLNYVRLERQSRPSAEELQHQRTFPFVDRPLMSIVVPVYNTPPRYLQELISSIQQQSYPNWELCIADGNSPLESARTTIRALAAEDARIRPLFLKDNLGISGNTNAAIAAAQGEYVVFADHDDILAPNALFELVRAYQTTGADFVYSDEDKTDERTKHFFIPNYKPDYSPEYLYSVNYICHISSIRRDKLLSLGGLRGEYDGSQDHDLNIRAAEAGLKIVHVPKVLYHWRSFRKSVSNQNLEKCYVRGRQSLKDHFQRLDIDAIVSKGFYGNKITYRIVGTPLVSIILPNSEESAQLEDYLRTHTAYGNFSFASSPASAEGEYLAFLGPDVYPDDSTWLTELLMYAQLPGVAAVGGAVSNSKKRILHRGLILLEGEARYSYYGVPETESGYMGMNKCTHNVSAVCGFFSMVKKENFKCNDSVVSDESFIHFCIDAVERGQRIVYTPYASAHTHGLIEPSQKKAYKVPIYHDPYYNPNLSSYGNNWNIPFTKP